MLKNLSALFLALPLISALTLNPPTTQVYSSSPLTVTWTVASGDPTNFDLYLTNEVFRNTFALKNQVTTSDGNITVTLPVVPEGSGYTLQASPIGNVNQVLSQTSQFNVALPSSSSLSSTSSGASSQSSLSGSSTISSLGSAVSSKSTPLSSTSSSSSSSSTVVPTGSFNGGNNGALSMTGIGATVVGILVAAGAFFTF